MKELYSALLKAKTKIGNIPKNRKAAYGRYADLDAILSAVEPALSEEGLVLVHRVELSEEGRNTLVTQLVHVGTAQSIESAIPLLMKDPNNPQQLGGSMTYARRYGITSLLSIVADDDDDGNTSAGKNRDGNPLPAKKQAPSSDSGEPKKKGVTVERVKEIFTADAKIHKDLVEALIGEFKRAGFGDSQIVPEIRGLLGRNFGQLSQLTEAEARTAVGHARKVGRGDADRLS